MRLMINAFRAALAVSCLAMAACGASGSADPLSSPNSNVAAARRVGASDSTASVNGTTIPSATLITDNTGNVWTVSAGVISENGGLAAYSANVTLLLYDNEAIYQENSAGGWWSWNGSAWVSTTDPRKLFSATGATIPAATQITDGSGNVWAVSGGVIYENGALAGYSTNVTLLLYDNGVIYQEDSAGGWWLWKGGTWVAGSDPRIVSSSATGTTIPSATQITDSSGNVWTVSGGVVYANGALAGYSANVTLLLYDNGVIYQENSAGGWWSWNGRAWTSSSDPRSAPAPTIAGSPSTSDAAGQAYSFVPTTTNPGGGTLQFSITNTPAWASFNSLTGALTGTPSSGQVGDYSNIVISVSNGSGSASLATFSITVNTGSAATGSAALSWDAPTQNTDGTPLTDLAGYTIYYGTSSSELTQTIQLANPSATTYVVSNLSAGTYYFALAAHTTAATQGDMSSIESRTIQ